MKALFIGGPVDGRRMTIVDEGVRSWFDILKRKRSPKITFEKPTPGDIDGEIHHYRLYQFCSCSESFYLHDSLTPDKIVPILIEGYRNEQTIS